MKKNWIIAAMLLALALLSACADSPNYFMPWETIDKAVVAPVATERAEMITAETHLREKEENIQSTQPYWECDQETIWIEGEAVSVGITASFISEEARESIIAVTPETYNELKGIDWECVDKNVTTNQNIPHLLLALRGMPLSERPHATYAEMRVAVLCENFSLYVGDKLYWADVFVTNIEKYKAGCAEADVLNCGNAYTVVSAQTNHNEIIQLYVMSDYLVDEFYSVGAKTTLQGWPVGQQNGTLILCVDRLAGG